MKCHNCPNNAMYPILAEGVGEVYLCLDCEKKRRDMYHKANEELKEQANYYSDQINSTWGIDIAPKYEIKKPTTNINHINLNNSQVGVLNTGNIGNLNQTIDTLYSVNKKELAANLKTFSQTVLDDTNLDDNKKSQVMECLDTITGELYVKPEDRKKSLTEVLFSSISDVVQFSANSLTAWQILHELLKASLQ